MSARDDAARHGPGPVEAECRGILLCRVGFRGSVPHSPLGAGIRQPHVVGFVGGSRREELARPPSRPGRPRRPAGGVRRNRDRAGADARLVNPGHCGPAGTRPPGLGALRLCIWGGNPDSQPGRRNPADHRRARTSPRIRSQSAASRTRGPRRNRGSDSGGRHLSPDVRLHPAGGGDRGSGRCGSVVELLEDDCRYQLSRPQIDTTRERRRQHQRDSL